MKKIAYLGPENSFTESVAKEIFKEDKLIPLSNIRNIVFGVEEDKFDLGVIPLENFYNGDVKETLDSLTESKNTRIISEKAVEIIHCLGALKEHKKIEKILSKDQALEQCSKFLSLNFPNSINVPTPSTSEAIEIIKKNNYLDSAAIASEIALKNSNFEILHKNLCPNNKTRFAIVGKSKTHATKDDRTLLVIHPPIDKPGILYNILKFFYEKKINLTSLQSRPDGKSGYSFYIELEGHETDNNVQKAMSNIKNFLDKENKYKDTIKTLGSWKNSHWKE